MLPLRSILLPFSLAYGGITRLRNRLYDRGTFRSFSFDRLLISVGNLAVGGTGKTPMVEYIVNHLKPQYALATLSRGYGRSTKGFRLATETDTANTLGDEPLQYYASWQQAVPVAVGEDRSLAITELLAQKPEIEVIVLDDAFQHRRVRPQVQVLLTTYKKPFWKDTLLPAGRLREAASGARRATLLVVTKCPADLPDSQRKHYAKKAQKHLRAGCPVVFTTIRYLLPQPLFATPNELRPGQPVILLSGLANASNLEKYVSRTYELLAHHRYGDHHKFTISNLTSLQTAYTAATSQYPKAVILTTQKDAMRLLEPNLREKVQHLPVYYLPISVQFLGKDEEVFWQTLTPYLPAT